MSTVPAGKSIPLPSDEVKRPLECAVYVRSIFVSLRQFEVWNLNGTDVFGWTSVVRGFDVAWSRDSGRINTGKKKPTVLCFMLFIL